VRCSAPSRNIPRRGVTSSTPHTDFYARITDVHPDGRSLAIAQTLRRLSTHELTDLGTPLHIAVPRYRE
jgi:predicted acyl esterase